MNKTQEIKAHAFDLLVTGKVTGVSQIWKHFGELNKLPEDAKKLQLILSAACVDAFEIAMDELGDK
jgi:hypothetical protein